MRPPIKKLSNAGLRIVYNEDGSVQKIIDNNGVEVLGGVPGWAGVPIAVPGVSVVESWSGTHRKLDFTFDEVSFTLTDDPGVGQYAGFAIYELPAVGPWLVEAAVPDLVVTLQAPFVANATVIIDPRLRVGVPSSFVDIGTEGLFVHESADCVARVATFNQYSLANDVTSDGLPAHIVFQVSVVDDAAHATTPGNTVSGSMALFLRHL